MNEKLRTSELEPGMVIRPFGAIIAIESLGEAEDKFLVQFSSGKSKTMRRNTKWWVEPTAGNEKGTEVVSHRRKPVQNTHGYEEDMGFFAHTDSELPVAHYAEKFQTHADAAARAVNDARMVSPTNPEGAVLYLHEATVQAALAQGHATMAAAMAYQGAGVEIAVKEM